MHAHIDRQIPAEQGKVHGIAFGGSGRCRQAPPQPLYFSSPSEILSPLNQ